MKDAKDESMIKAFKENVSVEIVAHLTLVGKSKQEVGLIVDEFSDLGIKKIVALRGDVAKGSFVAHQDGFKNTAEFVGASVWRAGKAGGTSVSVHRNHSPAITQYTYPMIKHMPSTRHLIILFAYMHAP